MELWQVLLAGGWNRPGRRSGGARLGRPDAAQPRAGGPSHVTGGRRNRPFAAIDGVLPVPARVAPARPGRASIQPDFERSGVPGSVDESMADSCRRGRDRAGHWRGGAARLDRPGEAQSRAGNHRAPRLGADLARLPGRLRRVTADPRTPRRARWLLIALAIYVASSIDLIPDVIPGIGHLDEMVIMPLMLRRIRRMVPPEVWAEHFPSRPSTPRRG